MVLASWAEGAIPRGASFRVDVGVRGRGVSVRAVMATLEVSVDGLLAGRRAAVGGGVAEAALSVVADDEGRVAEPEAPAEVGQSSDAAGSSTSVRDRSGDEEDEDAEGDVCPICLNGMTEGEKRVCCERVCRQVFHASCVEEWRKYKNSCPKWYVLRLSVRD